MQQVDAIEKNLEDTDVIGMIEDIEQAYRDHALDQQEQADELAGMCNRNARCEGDPDCPHRRRIRKMEADTEAAGHV